MGTSLRLPPFLRVAAVHAGPVFVLLFHWCCREAKPAVLWGSAIGWQRSQDGGGPSLSALHVELLILGGRQRELCHH